MNTLICTPYRYAVSLYMLMILFCLPYYIHAQVAPVSPPTGGFGIDGNLRANTPTSPSPFAANQGDWFDGPGGTGGFVFNQGAFPVFTPIDALRSGKATDAYTSNDNIFTNGSKFNDYIGDLRWFSNSAPDKNDINNALYHLARNQSNNDQWIFISGDRYSTNGTSYIDFELLQGSVTENANGTFTGNPVSTKPNGGGRTQNDVVISMEYTNGGSKPLVYIYQWKQSGGKWSFQQVTPSASLSANAFAETNRGEAITDLPYNSFGSPSYQQYAFVEAGINISYLLSLTGLACEGLSIQTLWVKTKASASSTAALKDYIKPLPVNFNFGTSSIDVILAKCVSDNNAYPLTALPTGGTFSGLGVSQVGSTYYFTPSTAGIGVHTINYSASGCNATTTITVNGLPTVTPGSYGPYCIDATAVTLGGSPVGGTWSGTGVSLTSGIYKFTPSTAGVGPHTLTYSFTDGNSCSNSATTSINVNELPATPVVSETPPNCEMSNGTVTVTSPIGVDYEYSNGGTYQSTTSFTVGSGASYSITVRNKNTQCVSATKTGTIPVQPATPSFTVCIIQPTLCEKGSLTINATGGSGFSYSIDGTDFTNTNGIFSNLGAASVTSVQVKNADGCPSIAVSCADLISNCAQPTSGITNTNTSIQEQRIITQHITMPGSDPIIKAFPNPYNDRIRFVVSTPEAGQGSLEVHNMLGQKVKTVYQGMFTVGTQNFDMMVPNSQQSTLIYVLRINGKQVSGKMLHME